MVAGSGERKGCDARTHHARARSAAELHEGRAGDPRPGGARSRPADRAHRAALRRTDVGGLLRPARPAPAGPEPRGRLRQPRHADGRGPDRDGAGVHREFTGPGRGLRRRQLHDRGGAGRREARRADGARGGRPAQLRRLDARGDQPAADRPAMRAAVRHVTGGGRPPGARGAPGGRGAPGRESDDRHAAGQHGPLRHGGGPGRARAAGPVCGRDPAPAVQRGRPGVGGRPGPGSARGRGRAGRDHSGAPARPGRAGGRRAGFRRAGRSPAAARHSPARLSGVHRPGPWRAGGDHGLRRGAGGNHAAPGAVPDPAAEHRAADHRDQREQPPGHPARAGRVGAQGVRRRAVRGRAAAAMGRSGRAAYRPHRHGVAGPGVPVTPAEGTLGEPQGHILSEPHRHGTPRVHGVEVDAVAEVDEPQDAAAGDPGLAAERDRLARALRETRLQLAMTQSRLSALEQSATMELGRTLVRAARRPWSRGVQLPADLLRLWRERGGLTGPGAATLALASAQLGDLAGSGERFLSALTAPGLDAPGRESAGWTPPGLVITGVLTEQACATLAPDAAVHPLLPHDADVVLESTGADLVCIEAAAMLAGSAWAYAADPAATDRGRRLGRLIAAARALGKPVIFVRNIPAHLAPGLDWVAASCDAVSGEGFGVQLARFNPVSLDGSRPSGPVYAGPRDPREPAALRALLDALTSGDPGPGLVRVTGQVPWRRRPALYREHALFVTASADQAREQLACGAHVIMIGDGPPVAGAVAADGGSWDAAALREVAGTLRGRAPLAMTGIRPVLRELFTAHATPARLAALGRLAGFGDHVISGRRIAVLAHADD